MSSLIRTYRKPKRIVKGKKHTIHIRNLTDKQHEELWSIRAYIKAFDWIDVIEWLINKYHEELQKMKVMP